MAYKLNLGAWGSVFAVPSAVVDEHLKIASAYQLKVLLYLLKNNNVLLDEKVIGDSLGMHPDDVKDSLSFWVDRKIINICDAEVTPAESAVMTGGAVSFTANTVVTATETFTVETQEEPQEPQKRPMARPVRPEPAYVIRRLGEDEGLAMLMDESQRIFGRVISNADASTLVMLHDTDGLPVDVILMLLQYCADNEKATMRNVERMGIQWASEGITTVSLAEEKIRSVTESYSYFNRMTTAFGMKNVGSPTQKQLTFARTWLGTWSFSDDMLRLAYERCVDTKGELNMSYINGILKRWYDSGWKNPDDVDSAPAKTAAKPAAKSKPKSKGTLETDASYDIEAYEKKSIFD